MTDTPAIFVTVAIGVASITAAIWTGWKFSRRRGRLLFSWEIEPLLAQGSPGLLEVHYRSAPVQNAHLVKLELWNVGSIDVSTSMFDAGEGIDIGLGRSTLYGALSSTEPDSFDVPGTGTVSPTVSLRPTLLKRKDYRAITLVVAEKPNIQILRNSLIDVDISERTDSQNAEMRLAAAALGIDGSRRPRRRR